MLLKLNGRLLYVADRDGYRNNGYRNNLNLESLSGKSSENNLGEANNRAEGFRMSPDSQRITLREKRRAIDTLTEDEMREIVREGSEDEENIGQKLILGKEKNYTGIEENYLMTYGILDGSSFLRPSAFEYEVGKIGSSVEEKDFGTKRRNDPFAVTVRNARNDLKRSATLRIFRQMKSIYLWLTQNGVVQDAGLGSVQTIATRNCGTIFNRYMAGNVGHLLGGMARRRGFPAKFFERKGPEKLSIDKKSREEASVSKLNAPMNIMNCNGSTSSIASALRIATAASTADTTGTQQKSLSSRNLLEQGKPSLNPPSSLKSSENLQVSSEMQTTENLLKLGQHDVENDIKTEYRMAKRLVDIQRNIESVLKAVCSMGEGDNFKKNASEEVGESGDEKINEDNEDELQYSDDLGPNWLTESERKDIQGLAEDLLQMIAQHRSKARRKLRNEENGGQTSILILRAESP